ncbi:MAG: glycosyltransferase [Phycisphaerales bacterium]|nr:MAG: glycosyltransferase [Phycisphaerales bacterium]
MKVSVITVCLNSAETIESTIRSVLGQTYEHVEYIVVDGGSSDGTLEILRTYQGRIAKCISESDGGIYNAMNKGICLATGQVISFLNADDAYAYDKVLSEVVALLSTRNLDAVYGDLVYVDRRDTKRIVRYWQAGEYRQKAFFHGWAPPHPTFFCRKCLFERCGSFNTKYRIAADFELMLRFIEKYGVSLGYVPKTLVRMRTAGRANTIRGIIRGNREIVDAFRTNGLKIPLQFFLRKPLSRIMQFLEKPVIQSP